MRRFLTKSLTETVELFVELISLLLKDMISNVLFYLRPFFTAYYMDHKKTDDYDLLSNSVNTDKTYEQRIMVVPFCVPPSML